MNSWGGGRAAHGADAVGAGEVRFEMEWVGLLYSNTDSETRFVSTHVCFSHWREWRSGTFCLLDDKLKPLGTISNAVRKKGCYGAIWLDDTC
jgi:hypothetical protein